MSKKRNRKRHPPTKPKPKPKSKRKQKRFKPYGFLNAGIKKRKQARIKKTGRATAKVYFKGVKHTHYSRKLTHKKPLSTQTKDFKGKRTYITLEGIDKHGKKIQRNSFTFRYSKNRYEKFLGILMRKYGITYRPTVYLTRILRGRH